MDDLVRQAMTKWPHVPDCYGWLGLDRRGHWWMRDDSAQSTGAFQSGQPGSRGSMLRHEKLIEFIHRNYEADGEGRWYFQNGPQRVYVELEITPWIWRVEANGQVHAHTGMAAEVKNALVDEKGHLYLSCHQGFGLVHSLDVGVAATCMEDQNWPLVECVSERLPQLFGYVISPQQGWRGVERA